MQSIFIKSASAPDQFLSPDMAKRDVIFVGRSNTGKSSLLSSLAQKKNLAISSSMPGRTQLVNFFQVGKNNVFIDLPGYGYSAISDKIRKNWQELIGSVLQRPSIETVLFLIDARRVLGGVDEEDKNVFEFLSPHPVMIALTKCDKLNRSDANQAHASASKFFNLETKDVILVSSLKKTGIDVLQKKLKLI